LLAHNIILKERWGIRFWTWPEATADILTIAVIVSAVFLILRCVALPRLRNITTVYDYVLLAILLAPLITGFLAYHQVPTYRFWLITHIICGEIMLIAIPFARIWHVL
jgi:nitrate reductase gamma subunit